ncbi:hypothetical protein BJV77DRAFT_739166 [Russula vinacea]|nr:hypothetical protein BJV77DRAFT_739166 [Russula vinacea]
MAPSKRPLFLPSPPATLDDFFRKPETSNSRSASSQAKKRVKANHRSSSQHEPRKKRVQSPGAEIIVLDSDDDTPLACTKRKAEDNSGCSSDVEVVEAVTRRTQDTSSSGKEVKVESGHKPGDFGTRELLAFSEDDASESDKPQLFSPAEDRVLHVTEGQDFQAASSIPSDDQLLPPSADPDDSHHLLSEIQVDSSDVLPTSLARLDSDNVIEIDDEWGTGDDELVRANGDDVEGVLELTDDEVEEILKPKDESPATSGEAINHCPFCGIDLTSFSSLDMQSHITTCSDSFLLQPLCLLSHLTIGDAATTV